MSFSNKNNVTLISRNKVFKQAELGSKTINVYMDNI